MTLTGLLHAQTRSAHIWLLGSEHGYDMVVTTQDWHINPGDHFSDEPDFVDTWPPRGVAGTAEAELHPVLAGAGAQLASAVVKIT